MQSVESEPWNVMPVPPMFATIVVLGELLLAGLPPEEVDDLLPQPKETM
jgi:hypothetical protein